eukprot:25596_1
MRQHHISVLFLLLLVICLYYLTHVQLLETFSTSAPVFLLIDIHNLTQQNEQLNEADEQYQSIINQYINILSQQNYDTFNKDIMIETDTFKRFSTGFMHHVLRHTSIVFIGDSIQYYWVNFIISQLHMYSLNQSHVPYQNKTLDVAAILTYFTHNSRLSIEPRLLNAFLTIFDEERKDYYPLNSYGASVIDGLFTFNITNSVYFWWQDLIPYDSPSYTQYLNHPHRFINVIVHNFGALHLLHLYPWRTFQTKRTPGAIIHLEQHFEFVMESIASNTDVRCVIFRAVNPVCDNRYHRDYKTAATFYHSIANLSSMDLLSNNVTRRCIEEYSLTSKQVLRYEYNNRKDYVPYSLLGIDLCSSKYTLLDWGVDQINERMSNWIYNKQKVMNDTMVKLIYLDVNKLYKNRCGYSRSNDGRHYKPLEPVSSVVLLNVVDKFCKV